MRDDYGMVPSHILETVAHAWNVSAIARQLKEDALS
jgi:hypothetical protein